MERQICDLQNQIVMLQCQNRLLVDKLDTYQTVAKRAAVRVAQYKKRRGQVNHKKVHTVTAEAGMQWDIEKWDGDIWDSTDSDEIGSPGECVDMKPILRWKLEGENG